PSSLAATEKLPPSRERTKARRQSIRSIRSFPSGIDHILSIPFFSGKFAARLQPTTGGPAPERPWNNAQITLGEADMRRRIGIVGAGIAGLHLALYLQKHGVDATLITDRAPDEYRGIRLLNTVAHHHVTIAREDYLGVNHWNDPKHHYYYHDHFFNFPQPISFRGYFSRPSRAVDYRIYLPVLM